MIIEGKYYQNSQGMTINSKDSYLCLTEYIWYYLITHKQEVYDCGSGTAQRAIVMDRFLDILLPLPTTGIQQQLTKTCHNILQNALTMLAEIRYMEILKNKNIQSVM
jgi:restriction endonuclease S subunit